MYEIKSFVFLDIETTGLPWQERNTTKITELSLVATSREDILMTAYGDAPPVSKISLVFNPCKTIHPEAVKMTGLTNELLKHSPLFQQKIETILSFLQELPKPVCLVAHNGNIFDYKILLAEFNDANACLPDDILCIDSLVGFKCVLKNSTTCNNQAPVVPQAKPIQPQKQEPSPDLMTDDEDDWPELNASTEDWDDIDNICNSLSDISCEEINEELISTPKKIKENDAIHVFSKAKSDKRSEIIRNVFSKEKKTEPNPNGYSLVALYQRLLKKEVINSHRAEADCLMLLECVVATKEAFIPWADSACTVLTKIQPLRRY